MGTKMKRKLINIFSLIVVLLGCLTPLLQASSAQLDKIWSEDGIEYYLENTMTGYIEVRSIMDKATTAYVIPNVVAEGYRIDRIIGSPFNGTATNSITLPKFFGAWEDNTIIRNGSIDSNAFLNTIPMEIIANEESSDEQKALLLSSTFGAMDGSKLIFSNPDKEYTAVNGVWIELEGYHEFKIVETNRPDLATFPWDTLSNDLSKNGLKVNDLKYNDKTYEQAKDEQLIKEQDGKVYLQEGTVISGWPEFWTWFNGEDKQGYETSRQSAYGAAGYYPIVKYGDAVIDGGLVTTINVGQNDLIVTIDWNPQKFRAMIDLDSKNLSEFPVVFEQVIPEYRAQFPILSDEEILNIFFTQPLSWSGSESGEEHLYTVGEKIGNNLNSYIPLGDTEFRPGWKLQGYTNGIVSTGKNGEETLENQLYIPYAYDDSKPNDWISPGTENGREQYEFAVFKAIWGKKFETVNFLKNDGTQEHYTDLEEANSELYDGDLTDDIVLEKPEREGYKFTGWEVDVSKLLGEGEGEEEWVLITNDEGTLIPELKGQQLSGVKAFVVRATWEEEPQEDYSDYHEFKIVETNKPDLETYPYVHLMSEQSKNGLKASDLTFSEPPIEKDGKVYVKEGTRISGFPPNREEGDDNQSDIFVKAIDYGAIGYYTRIKLNDGSWKTHFENLNTSIPQTYMPTEDLTITIDWEGISEPMLMLGSRNPQEFPTWIEGLEAVIRYQFPYLTEEYIEQMIEEVRSWTDYGSELLFMNFNYTDFIRGESGDSLRLGDSFGDYFQNLLPIGNTTYRPGYKFKGWWNPDTNELLKSEDIVKSAILEGMDINGLSGVHPYSFILNATWAAHINVDVLMNDATENHFSEMEEANDDHYNDDPLSDLSFEVPQRTGYEFLGWEGSMNGSEWTTVTDKVGELLPGFESMTFNGDVTLRATWEEVPEETTYTVNYDLGYEGSVTPISKTVEFGEAGLLPDDAPTRVGYKFKGWKTSNDTEVTNQTKYSDLVDNNEETTSVTLTAQWAKKVDLTIYQYINNTVNTFTQMQNANNDLYVGDSFSEIQFMNPEDFETFNGEHFKGWEIETNGDRVQLTNEDCTILPAVSSMKFESDAITLHPIWYDEERLDVSFDTNGGKHFRNPEDPSSEAQEGIFDTYNRAPFSQKVMANYLDGFTEGLSREGYTFVGWNTKKDRSGTWINEDHTMADLIDMPHEDIPNPNGESSPNEYRVIYAQWTKDHVARNIPINVTLNVEPKEMLQSENVRKQFTTDKDGGSPLILDYIDKDDDHYGNCFWYDENTDKLKANPFIIQENDSLYDPDKPFKTQLKASDGLLNTIVDEENGKIYRLKTDPITLSEPRPLVWNTDMDEITVVYDVEYEEVNPENLGIQIAANIRTDDGTDVTKDGAIVQGGFRLSYSATSTTYPDVFGGFSFPEEHIVTTAETSGMIGFYPGNYTLTADGSQLEGKRMTVDGKRYLYKNFTPESQTVNPYSVYNPDTKRGEQSVDFEVNFQRLMKIHYELNEGRYDGSDTIDDVEVVANGGRFTTPQAPDRAGFSFAGWKVLDVGGDPLNPGQEYEFTYGFKDITLEAQWVPATAPYTVYHHYEDLSGNYDEDVLEQHLEGTIGEPVSGEEREIEGFTYDPGIEGTNASGQIEEDGRLVLDLYYKRNVHKVSYQQENSPVPGVPVEEDTVKFGAPVTLKDKPTILGYIMSDWSTSDATIVNNAGFAMPDKDVTLTGTWTRDSNYKKYKVEYYQEKLGWGYDLVDTSTVFESATLTMDEVVDEKKDIYMGFTYNSNEFEWYYVYDSEEDTLIPVLELYYTRNKHDVNFHESNVPNGREAEEDRKEVQYGAKVEIQEPGKIPGYTFSKWDVQEENDSLEVAHGDNVHSFVMPDNDVHVTGSWVANEYKVSYDLNYPGAPTMGDIEGVHWEDNDFYLEPETNRDHYQFRGWALESNGTDNITGQRFSDLVNNDDTQESVTLYAIWEEDPFMTVRWGAGEHGSFEGGVDEITNDHCYVGDPTPNEPTVIADEHYRFKEWSPYVENTVTVDVTYIAQYEPVEYNVTYQPGEHGAFNSQNYVVPYDEGTPGFEGEPKGEPGYQFLRWDVDPSEKVTGDATYVALWETKPVNVTFYNNYTEDDVETYQVAMDANRDVRFGDKVNAEFEKPERENYTFKEWTTDREGENAWNFENVIDSEGDINLYAQWDEKTQKDTEQRVVTRTIQYVMSDGTVPPAEKVQTAVFTREGEKYLAQDETKWGDWKCDNPTFEAVETPIIAGYTADKSVIPEIKVTEETENWTVTVKYTKNEETKPDPNPEPEPVKTPQPVFIQYVDEDGITIASTMKVEGKLGDEKTVQAIAIDGYQLALGHPSSYSFTITDAEQEFAFVYTKSVATPVPEPETPVPALSPQPITIHYVDDKGNTIHSSLVIHGEIGDVKKVTAPSIEWYTLVTKGSTQTFTVSDKKQSFTFVYKREQLKDTMGDEEETSDDESEGVPKVTTSTEDSSSTGTSRNTLPSTAEISSGSSSNNLPTTGETQEMWIMAIGAILTSVGAVFYIKRKQKA